MMQMTGPLEASWQEKIGKQLQQPYMQALCAFLQQEAAMGKVIYPPRDRIFHAFQQTPFDRVKVVILGQDPYHGAGQAHGLSFSVPAGVAMPPSLKNIAKEIAADLDQPMRLSGDLSAWAQQGVLLLNATLTVEQGLAGSHQKRGWEQFTDAAITALNQHRKGLAFILWGNNAQKKSALIDASQHMVLRSAHPSPLSAHRGFFGQHLFSQVNAYLQQQGLAPIDWSA